MYNNIVSLIIASLTDDLRKPQYRGSKNKLTGHCYVATEALYHLLGGKCNGWKPMFIRHEDLPHWFLQGSDGKIIDITSDQFKTKINYKLGVGKGFLTKKPSKRSKIVIANVNRAINK